MANVFAGLSLLLALVAADPSESACESTAAASGARVAANSRASQEHLFLQAGHLVSLAAHGQLADEVKRPLKGIATMLSDLKVSEADAAKGAIIFSHVEMAKVRKVLESVIDDLKEDASTMHAGALVRLKQAKLTLEHAVEHGVHREHVEKDLTHVVMNLEHAREDLKRSGTQIELTGEHVMLYIQNALTDLQVSHEDGKAGKHQGLNLKHTLRDTQYILTYLNQMEDPPDNIASSLKKAVLHLDQALNDSDEGKRIDVANSITEVRKHLENAKVKTRNAFPEKAK